MRNTYLKEVYNLAAKDRNVLSLVADNGMIVYDDFRRDFPEQYFNFGISEGHMITAAAGFRLHTQLELFWHIVRLNLSGSMYAFRR